MCWKDIGANLLHRADRLNDTCGPRIGLISADLRVDVIVLGGCKLCTWEVVPVSCKRGNRTLGRTWYAGIMNVHLATWNQVTCNKIQNA